MKKTNITVTEAARNFADCVNRAHYQHVTFVLLKNGEPVARLVPTVRKFVSAAILRLWRNKPTKRHVRSIVI
jgi:prevent-host-death family protein